MRKLFFLFCSISGMSRVWKFFHFLITNLWITIYIWRFFFISILNCTKKSLYQTHFWLIKRTWKKVWRKFKYRTLNLSTILAYIFGSTMWIISKIKHSQKASTHLCVAASFFRLRDTVLLILRLFLKLENYNAYFANNERAI